QQRQQDHRRQGLLAGLAQLAHRELALEPHRAPRMAARLEELAGLLVWGLWLHVSGVGHDKPPTDTSRCQRPLKTACSGGESNSVPYFVEMRRTPHGDGPRRTLVANASCACASP